MNIHPSPRNPFSRLTSAGYHLPAYEATVEPPRVIQRGGRFHLIYPGPRPVVIYASEDRQQVDWIDFSIELVAGIIALVTGFKVGRDGYIVLRPVIDDLYENDAEFRALVQDIGERTLVGDALQVGKGVRDLWVYLWQHHRRAILNAIFKAIGRAISLRSLALMFVRWLVRLVSSGAAFLMEIGLLIMPLSRKLRNNQPESPDQAE